MQCKMCGWETEDDSKYCGRCGAPLGDLPPQKADDSPEPPHTKWYVGIACFLAGIIVVLVVLLGRSGAVSSPEPGPREDSAGAGTVVESNDEPAPGEDTDGEPDEPALEGADVALEFVRAWYDDWSLDGDNRRDNTQDVAERCLSLINESSPLYSTADGALLEKATYSEKTDAATCVVEEPKLLSESDGTYRVSIWYTSDQEANWSPGGESTYKWLVESRRHEASWDVAVDDEGKVTAIKLVPRGPYTLSGTLRSHDESFNGGRITVLSMVLDEPVSFKAEYKGTYEGEAKEVAIATSQSDAYAEWARYDGRHLTVECESLSGAYHDASQYNVDSLAGDVQLVEAEEPDDVAQDADVLHLDGCDLAIPEAWRGEVVQGQRLGDINLNWKSFHLLSVRQCSPDEFPTYNTEVDSYVLGNGTDVVIRRGADFSYEAEVPYGSGKGLILYLFAYNDSFAFFSGLSDEECSEYLELQAAAAGMSADDDPNQIAIAALKACLAGLTFEE